MKLIKAKFLKDGEPSGRAYTYIAEEKLQVGDLVQLNERGQGIVVEIDVPETEVESFKDKLKAIRGKVEEQPEKEQLDGVYRDSQECIQGSND